jgi:hypothetical protein
MEDYCWEVLGGSSHIEGIADIKDIVLDADSAGDVVTQRKNGLGSFFNFKVS